MEDKIKKNWLILKGVLQYFTEERNRSRVYLTVNELEIFEQKIKRAIREKKLKRIRK